MRREEVNSEAGFMLVEVVIAAAVGLLIASVLGIVMVSSAKAMVSSVLYHRARGALDEATAQLTVDTRAATTAPVVSAGGTQVVIGPVTWAVVGDELQRNGVEIVPTDPKMHADYDAPPFSYDGVLHFALEVDTAYQTVHESTAIAGPAPTTAPTTPPPAGPLSMTQCPTLVSTVEDAPLVAATFEPVFTGSAGRVDWDFHDPRPSADDRQQDDEAPWTFTYSYPWHGTFVVDVTVFDADTEAVPDRVSKLGCQYTI